MSESNLPNSDEKTEQNLSPPEGGPETQDLGNSQPDLTEGDAAQMTDEHRDTLPPAVSHGWLEQFEAFGWESFEKLKAVAAQGLVAAEVQTLIFLAAKLTSIALEHDEDALEKVVDQVNAFSKQTG